MDWIRRFMAGRYGADRLSTALLVLSVVMAGIAQAARFPALAFASYLPLAICIYRMLSRNISKRSMENYKFTMLAGSVLSWFRKIWFRIGDMRTHKYMGCPSCKARLRLPRGKGNIIATCPKCRAEFKTKT